jgi:hypothetical protein
MDANQTKTQCTNCKCWRDKEMFIGRKGGIVKRCLRCREKDAVQKSKPEIREKRNARNREKAYHITHRAKKRAENEVAYLKHNADVMKNWRNNNKDHVKEWRMQNVNYMLHAIKGQSQKKQIPWTLTDEQAHDMMTSLCEYCGYKSDAHVNGIDRKNNNDGYNANNCVACCKYCNFIKKALDPSTFIERCLHISYCHGGYGQLNANHTLWKSTRSCSFNHYKQRAERKGLPFELTVEEFNTFVNGTCYYCNKTNDVSHRNGVDRKDNTYGYTTDNCVACCGECNQMKADMNSTAFIECIKRVAEYNKDSEHTKYQDIPRCYCVIAKRNIIV